MKDHLKQLFSESAIYGLSSIVPKLIGLILIPFYTRVLIPEDYGLMNLVNAFFSLAIMFSLFALDNSASRWYYDTEDEQDQKLTISSWFWFYKLLSILMAILFLLSSDWFSKKVFDLSDPLIFYIAVANFVAGVLPQVSINWFRMRRKPKQTVAFTLSQSFITIGLTIYFVLVQEMGVLGIFTAMLIGNLLYSLISVLILNNWLSPSYFNLDRLKEMLAFALPMVPTAIALWVYNTSGSFFIEYYSGKSELGLFQTGVSLASGLVILVFAFKMAFPPFAFSIYKKEMAKRIFAIVLHLYSMVSILAALIVALFSKELLVLLTQANYYEAYLVIAILSFYNILYGYGFIVGLGNQIAKNNKPQAIAIFLGAAITLILFATLVPKFGKEGAASAMLIGASVIPIYLYSSAQKNWRIPFKPYISLSLFISGIGATIVYFQFLESNGINNWLIRFALLLGFIFINTLVIKQNDTAFYQQLKSYLSAKQVLLLLNKLRN